MFDPLRKQIEKFVPINEADWALLLPHLNLKTIKKNTLFSKEGKVSKDIGFIIEGSLRHFYNKDGEEKTTYFYFENSFVCDYISCISHLPGKLSIEALSDCQLIVFPYAALEILYTKSHQWERFGRLVAEYLANGLEDRMVGLLMLSPEERYIQLLQSNKHKILERIPQHLVANYLGITPVSLSRIRNRINKGH